MTGLMWISPTQDLSTQFVNNLGKPEERGCKREEGEEKRERKKGRKKERKKEKKKEGSKKQSKR